jgi:C4-dicarboxylate-specific signal transduction histidine kinase
MATRPDQKPVRIPPPRHPGPQSPTDTTQTAHLPSEAFNSGSLERDGALLQNELDNVVAQFDSLRAQLRQAQKLATIGTTAAMIAHEFNNLFTPVMAYARQALDTDDVELMKIALNKTLERVDVMRSMADRVIGLAKQSQTAVTRVGVRELVENAIECLCRDLDKDQISVNLQIDPELAVRANENQLLQVLFNLVINARQAMLGRRGRLTADAAPTRDAKVRINIRDTGCGIAPENLERIFEPFFSTKRDADKPDRRGLGLGLAICRDIIEDLDGTITVESAVNAGTTFTITLPAAE